MVSQESMKQYVKMKDRKSAIVTAATELFMQKGYAATSMSMLAAKVGISKPALYHHFSSKEAVFIGCIQNGYSDHVEQLEAILAVAGEDHFVRLEQMQKAVYDALVYSNAGRLSPIIAETSQRFPEVAMMFYEQFIGPMYRILTDFLADGIARDIFVQTDKDAFEQVFFGVPVNLSLTQAMFAKVETPYSDLDVDAVRKSHLGVLRAMLS